MPNSAHDGAGRRTHGADARSQASVTHRTAAPVRALPTAARAEGIVLRMAGVFSADLASHPHARIHHQAYLDGALAMALELGVLTDARAMAVRRAGIALYDGARHDGSVRGHKPDPAFAALVTAVRRHGRASLNEPLAMAEMAAGDAAWMLGRLIAAGVVDGGDAAGFHRATKGDC